MEREIDPTGHVFSTVYRNKSGDMIETSRILTGLDKSNERRTFPLAEKSRTEKHCL